MPKIKTTVTRESKIRSDAGRRRKRPKGNTDMGTGYRVNPKTDRPELWCSNCETFKHITFYRKASAPRSRRICTECEERLSRRAAPEYGIMSVLKGPYGGDKKFGEEIWPYMKDTLAPPKGRGSGTKGRPVTRLIKGKAIKRILSGVSKLPASHPTMLRMAIMDPDNRVHFKTRLWLAFRQGVLDDRQLRLCGCALADRLMDDVTEYTQDDIYFGLGSVIEDMRALALGEAYYSRQRLEGLRAKVAQMEEIITRRESKKEFDHIARRVFFVLTALLSGSALIAMHSIAFEFLEHFMHRFDSRDATLQDMLVRICGVIDEDSEAREREEVEAKQNKEAGKPDALIGTYWQEYDHHSPTRFLLVTDVHKHVVQLRVVSNEDTEEEVGEFIDAERNQFDGLGPGYFMQLFPEDIRDSGVPLGRINRRLTSWGLTPIQTEIDHARRRREEIESEETETDPTQ